MKVLIGRCPQNHPYPSIGVCPANALHQEGFAAPTVDHNACTTCGVCAKDCPMQAPILVGEG